MNSAFPPFHPVLVNFTAALIPTSLLADLIARMCGYSSLRATAWWTLAFAAVMTPFTALAGWLWLDDMGGSHHPQMAIHKWLGTAMAAGAVGLAVWRGCLYWKDRGPGLRYAAAAVFVLGGLVYQADLGGSMSFGRGFFTGQTGPASEPPHPGQVDHAHEHSQEH